MLSFDAGDVVRDVGAELVGIADAVEDHAIVGGQHVEIGDAEALDGGDVAGGAAGLVVVCPCCRRCLRQAGLTLRMMPTTSLKS